MADTLFLTSDELSALVSLCGQCAAAGVGMGFMFWALGAAIRFLYDFVRF